MVQCGCYPHSDTLIRSNCHHHLLHYHFDQLYMQIPQTHGEMLLPEATTSSLQIRSQTSSVGSVRIAW
jgi:hypothetical protein